MNSRPHSCKLFTTFATFLSLATLLFHSNDVEAVFASAKSTGMGGTAISYPLDTLSGAYNVAGPIDIGDRIDVEGAWVHDTGTATLYNDVLTPGGPIFVSETYNGMRTKNIVPVNIGFNKNWCLGCDWTLSTGAIVYNRSYQKTTYKKIIELPLPEDFPSIPFLGTTKPGLEYLNETLSAIVGIKWCDVHMIAISADYQIERLKVNGLENFRFLSISPNHVTNKGYDYSSGCGLSVGYLGHITPSLTIGVNYSPEVSMRKMHKYDGFLAGGRLNVPRRIGFGLSYKILCCLAVAFDVEQIQWSHIRALHNPVTQDGVIFPLGSDLGPGFGFRDQWFYRLGIEWVVNDCWSLRAGFRHANSPIRNTQTAVNLLTLDTVEDYITAGATWFADERNELSIVGVYGFENKIKGKDSIPLQFGGGNVDLKEQKFAIGLAWGYKY